MKETTYLCPTCKKRTIKPSGFNGNPFCWGKCYHYFKWEDINTKTHKETIK